MTEDQQPQRLITRREIASLAGVRTSAVSNWISRHKDTFPTSPDGTHFDAEAVLRWLVEQGRLPEGSDLAAAGARQVAWTLLGLVRGELDTVDALAYAATQVTLFHLHPEPLETDPLTVARDLEDRGVIAAPALTEILSRAPQHTPASEMRWREAWNVLSAAAESGASSRDVFDAILAQAESAGRFVGEHFTPRLIADLATGLLPGDYASVLDPACGFGTLLVAAARRQGVVRQSCGLDVSPTAVALSEQNAQLHGLENAEVIRADALDWLPLSDERFDAVVSHPPFALRVPDHSQARLWAQAEIGKGARKADLLWVLLAKRMLSPEGRAVVLTTPGSLFGGGIEERIRSELLRTRSVEAIISIPAGQLVGTAIGAAVWVVGPTGSCRNEVLVADLSPEDVTDSAKFLQLFHWWRAQDTRFSVKPGTTAVVPVLELMGDSVNLTPRQWVQVPESADQFIATARTAVRSLTEGVVALNVANPPTGLSLIGGAQPEMKRLSQLEALGMVEVLHDSVLRQQAEMDVDGEPVYSRITSGGGLRATRQVAVVPEKALRTRPGDVVLQSTGAIGATVDHEGGHLIADPLWVIRPLVDDPRVGPELLALLLSSPRINNLALGTTVKRLRIADVTLPLLDQAEAERLGAVALALQETRAAASQIAASSSGCLAALVGAVEAGGRLEGSQQ